MSPRFMRPCGDTEPHTGHEYVKRWELSKLPLLPNPERYPAEWDATYSCRGIKLPGKTWAESLGIEVPADAPGGQKIGSPISGRHGAPQNRLNADYDGFHDVDGWGRSS